LCPNFKCASHSSEKRKWKIATRDVDETDN
jgi:hypothetical protein